MAQSLELMVTAWSPLGGGLLTGAYGTDRKGPSGTRIATMGRATIERELTIADAVNAIAAERGVTSAQVAIALVCANRSEG